MNERETPGVKTAARPFTIADLHSFFDPTSASVGQLQGDLTRTENIVGTAQSGIQHSAEAGTAQPG